VAIDVVDSGAGIPAEHMPRLFEPFFTARPGGTGLGLAISHSIVQRHGGRLQVRSEVGRGTTVMVTLPASERPAQVGSVPPSGTVRFSGRALVMDDEEGVRRVASALLKRLGFEVETTAHGAGAVDLAAQRNTEQRPFRVALLDLTVVGGLGAAEIAVPLRKASPGIRLVLTSGYAHQGAREDWDAELPKPYTLAALSAALGAALNEPGLGDPQA
jgi:CheY-like chemotaxis protein